MTLPDRVDVVVAGGGPAGIGAALGAARHGAKTLLLERHAFFGGVAAYGMGMPMNQMRPEGRPRGAMHEALIARLCVYGDDAVRISGHALVCNVEYLKVAVMDALDEAGCDYLLHSRVVDALVEGNRVTGVVLATKEGPVRVRAGAVVDATGDADVAYYAGAATLKGREGDGYLSPMTLNFIISNIDVAAARAAEAADHGFHDLIARARARYPLLPERMHFELAPFPIANALVINHAGTKAVGVLDGTRPEDLTVAERYSRRQALQIVAALREFGGPVFAGVQLGATGPQVGVRETRRVKGVYALTEADAQTGSRFDDAIANGSYRVDIHHADGPGITFRNLDGTEEVIGERGASARRGRWRDPLPEDPTFYQVPFRCLLPGRVPNLVLAGRMLDADDTAYSAVRVMVNLNQTGEAAGVACALALDGGGHAADADPRRLRARLAEGGSLVI